MSDVGGRMDGFERRLDAVHTEVGELRGEVGELRGEVGGLRGEVGGLRGEVGELRGEVGELRGEVHQLRVLGEKNTDDIRKIAEVQAHHGRKLDEISLALAPLKEMHDFIRRVAPNHELRIQALEKHTGLAQ